MEEDLNVKQKLITLLQIHELHILKKYVLLTLQNSSFLDSMISLKMLASFLHMEVAP